MPGVDELSKAIHSLGCGKTPVRVIDGISSTMILHEEWETSTFAGSILTNALSLLGKTIMSTRYARCHHHHTIQEQGR